MGKSITINCVGLGPEKIDTDTGIVRRRVYDAMSKEQISQEIEKARRKGEKIIHWYAQTKTGEKILGSEYIDGYVKTENIKLPKLVKCPVCNGQGRKKDNNPDEPFATHCNVCRGSGIYRRGTEKRWADWQIERMKEEFSS